MKTIKRIFITGVSLLALNAWVACNSDNTARNDVDGTKQEADQHNDAKFNDNKAERDADFLAEAANISLIEMNLGQLAEGHAMRTETKDLGRMMSQDHKKAYDEIANLASKKAVTIPTAVAEGDRKTYNDLSEKRGRDFDKEYIDKMVSGHKDAIDKFEKAAKDAVDPDIQTFANNMLPTLRNHLDHAMNMQQKLAEMDNTNDRDQYRDTGRTYVK